MSSPTATFWPTNSVCDANEIVLKKLALTREKYPIDKSRGRSEKYDQL